jgi:hypothetical protein
MLLFCSTALKSGPMLTHLSICYIDSNINVKQVLNSEKKKITSFKRTEKYRLENVQ